MEADWSVEVGAGVAVIDDSWPGWIDLRSSPCEIDTVEEARLHGALRKALLALNSGDSSLFTVKCDAWALPGDEIDPDEFAASSETARVGFASYMDVVEFDAAHFRSFELQEQRARELTTCLRALDLRQSRVDFVVRPAFALQQSGYGMTVYAAGCGPGKEEAYAAWQAALGAAVAATIAGAARPRTRASSSIG